eukprot:2719869-Pleurochrysis_carterae.AAC.3
MSVWPHASSAQPSSGADTSAPRRWCVRGAEGSADAMAAVEATGSPLIAATASSCAASATRAARASAESISSFAARASAPDARHPDHAGTDDVKQKQPPAPSRPRVSA